MLTETSNIKVVLPAWVYTGEQTERDMNRMAHRYRTYTDSVCRISHRKDREWVCNLRKD